MTYCTYVKFSGFTGVLVGWVLIGISKEPNFGGYASDFMARGNIKMMLLEMEPPLISNFRFFRPWKSKIIQYLSFKVYRKAS